MSVTKVGPNKYRIFISDGFNLDGSRRRFSKTITTDLKGRDLERFLMLEEFDFEDEIKKKDPKFQELAKGTFEAYSNWWLDYKVTHEDMAPKTKEEYKKYLDARILNFVGNKILEKITNGDMLELIKEIKNSPAKTKSGKLSEKSVKNYFILLKSMFSTAIKLKILIEDPMENITVKSPEVKLKDNYYDLDDINKLLAILPSAPVKYQLAILLTMSAGFRLGELTALQWKHIDFESMEITVEQSNSYTKEKGSFIKDTKNTYSERTVALPQSLVNLFLEHKEMEKLKKESLQNKWLGSKDDKDDFVFTQDNGKCIFIGTIPKWFRNFIRKHNLKYITFHGLRHTHTTILIYKGVNIINISKQLGHAKTSTTTDFYAHPLRSVEREIANNFDEIIKGGTKSGTKSQKFEIVK